jgi:hypothetical protein
VFKNCPSSFTNYTNDDRLTVVWTEPEVFDPNDPNDPTPAIGVKKNYQMPNAQFIWGDFTVSYFAEKRKNGLQSECAFNISVRRKSILMPNDFVVPIEIIFIVI